MSINIYIENDIICIFFFLASKRDEGVIFVIYMRVSISFIERFANHLGNPIDFLISDMSVCPILIEK